MKENMASPRHCNMVLLLVLAAAGAHQASGFLTTAPRTIAPRAPAKLLPAQTTSSVTAHNSKSNDNVNDNSRLGASVSSLGRRSRGKQEVGLSGMAIAACSVGGGWGATGARSGAEKRRFQTLSLDMSTLELTEGSIDGGDGGGGIAVEQEVGNDFDVKTDLLNQIDLASSSKKRTAVNELMLKLEPMNPSDAPARSAMLNGVWEFLYTGGLSPGTLAVQVLSRVAKTFSAVVDLKGVTLTINRNQPRVEAAVKGSIFGTEVQVKVRTRLEVASDMRLQEVYEEAEVAGVTIPIPARVQPRRTLFVTYLDDDIMVARDDSGAPDLLIRKEKEFRFNTGTPSTSENDSSPGSG